jgi:hypothetical protein
MAVPLTNTNEISYAVDHPIQKQFLRNSKFCLSLQNYMQNLLSISIAIIPQQHLSENQRYAKKSSDIYTIRLSNVPKNTAELKQIIFDLIKNLFQSIQSKVFHDDKGL